MSDITIIRGVLKATTEGTTRVVSIDGRTDEALDKIEFLQHAGFASRPKMDVRVLVFIVGNRAFCIAEDDTAHRPELADGDMSIFTPSGVTVHLKDGNKTIEATGFEKAIFTTTSGLEFKMDGTKLAVGGATEIDLGDGALQKLVDARIIPLLNGFITAFNTHSGHGTGGTPPSVNLIVETQVETAVTKAS